MGGFVLVSLLLLPCAGSVSSQCLLVVCSCLLVLRDRGGRVIEAAPCRYDVVQKTNKQTKCLGHCVCGLVLLGLVCLSLAADLAVLRLALVASLLARAFGAQGAAFLSVFFILAVLAVRLGTSIILFLYL